MSYHFHVTTQDEAFPGEREILGILRAIRQDDAASSTPSSKAALRASHRARREARSTTPSRTLRGA